MLLSIVARIFEKVSRHILFNRLMKCPVVNHVTFDISAEAVVVRGWCMRQAVGFPIDPQATPIACSINMQLD